MRELVRGDRGSTTLELAIVFPVVLLIVVALVQYALWFHARSLATAAAVAGVTTARAYQSSPDAGRVEAEEFIAAHAGDLLTDPVVTASAPSPGHVAVQIRAHMLTLAPLLPAPPVVAVAEGPVERFVEATP